MSLDIHRSPDHPTRHPAGPVPELRRLDPLHLPINMPPHRHHHRPVLHSIRRRDCSLFPRPYPICRQLRS
jgi:hypothetical protein